MSTVPTIDWLVVRGRAALEAHRRVTGVDRRPGDHELIVVVREDFERNVLVCLDYAIHQRPVHILSQDGTLLALLCRHTGQ